MTRAVASSKSPGSRAIRKLFARKSTITAFCFLCFVCLLTLATPWLPLSSPKAIDLAAALSPPQLDVRSSASHLDDSVRGFLFGDTEIHALCGTDALGRDLLSRILWGARISLVTALAAAFVSLTIGVLWGATAGFVGGWLDNVMMRIVDVLYSIPFIFLVIFFVTVARGVPVFSGTMGNLTVFLVTLGLVYWLTMARVVHGQVISLREREYVEAARALGGSSSRLVRSHVFPNLLPVIIVTLTLTIPKILLVEAFLSFLGLGVQAPLVSWGTLSRDAFEVMTPIDPPWWLIFFPSVVIVATLGALGHLGDALRDALDPKDQT